MVDERLRKRLRQDRPFKTIVMRIPVDVLQSLKIVAGARGFVQHRTLIKHYLGEGLRRDEPGPAVPSVMNEALRYRWPG